MKNKRLLFLLIIVLIIILISLFIVIKNFVSFNNDENNLYNEYIPQEEISSNQMLKTKVILYYKNTNNELKSEIRLIDSISLLQNPYIELTNLLLENPKSKDLYSVFPESTKILETTLTQGCLTLNFSSELLNYEDETQKNNIINSLLNTLTQLNEVNSIKILVNNEENENFKL